VALPSTPPIRTVHPRATFTRERLFTAFAEIPYLRRLDDNHRMLPRYRSGPARCLRALAGRALAKALRSVARPPRSRDIAPTKPRSGSRGTPFSNVAPWLVSSRRHWSDAESVETVPLEVDHARELFGGLPFLSPPARLATRASGRLAGAAPLWVPFPSRPSAARPGMTRDPSLRVTPGEARNASLGKGVQKRRRLPQT